MGRFSFATGTFPIRDRDASHSLIAKIPGLFPSAVQLLLGKVSVASQGSTPHRGAQVEPASPGAAVTKADSGVGWKPEEQSLRQQLDGRVLPPPGLEVKIMPGRFQWRLDSDKENRAAVANSAQSLA